MSIVASHVGIDVAKDNVVVSVEGAKAFSVPNTEQALLAMISSLPHGAVIHLESSGGFERLARRILVARGFQVRVLNPYKCRRLAQGRGVKAKTDPVDARMLAQMGSLVPAGEPKTLDRQRLTDISRAVSELQKIIAGLKTRCKLPDLHESVVAEYKKAIKDLRVRVRELQKTYENALTNSQYASLHELALSVNCIGPATARILVCELPEDFKSRKLTEIASYAAVAPIDNSSGKKKGPAHVGHGNRRIKAALFLPALLAVRREDWARDHYGRLRAKGKSHQTAMVAVMRRLLLRVVEVMQRGTPWADVRPTT